MIHAPGHLANRCARCKRLRDNRPLLLRAPPPTPLRARQQFNAAHRTVSCIGASHSACTDANRRRIIPARVRRPLADGYTSTLLPASSSTRRGRRSTALRRPVAQTPGCPAHFSRRLRIAAQRLRMLRSKCKSRRRGTAAAFKMIVKRCLDLSEKFPISDI